MKDFLHYENNGAKWIWYWHSWTDGKNISGKWYTAKYFCTDSNGEGVFVVDLKRNERNQIMGTCDFSLVGLKDAKRAIRRWCKAVSA